MIIGLTGLKRHGKGTCGGVLVREYGFVQVDFTDALNEMLMKLDPIVGGDRLVPVRYSQAMNRFGYDRAKEKWPEIVRLMQVFGTEVGREMIDPDLWTKQWLKRVDPLLDADKNVVVTNVRFDNEAHTIAKWYDDAHIWKVVRPGYIHDPEAHKHKSEGGIAPDFIEGQIIGSTVEEIENGARAMMHHIS
jgi:hypothetical protein